MKIGLVTESYPGEQRVALVPTTAQALVKRKLEVVMQTGAGVAAGYPDEAYAEVGVRVLPSRDAVLAEADVFFFVRVFAKDTLDADLRALGAKHTVIGFCEPLGAPERARSLAAQGVKLFAMELMPRITRAQSMDALSSMATLAGYKAVLLAATQSPRMFPMLMTAAGTVNPAKVLVLGVGVAGLQAIATAKRLGAVVEAYDVRPEVRDQVKSVGGTFIDLGLDTSDASGKGGYAKGLSPEQLEEQRKRLGVYVRAADVIITTAQVPGRRAPTLVTTAMLEGARPGAVLVDLAAEQGGNCELTKAGQTYTHAGVSIMGPLNITSTLPFHASQLYARNVLTFFLHLLGKGESLTIDTKDEITRETLVSSEALQAAQRSAS